MDFSPISVTPKGIDLFSEYKVVYDERSQRLKRVLHKEDGPVLYEGIKDQGEFGLWDGEPIHIYSMVHSEKTHRILHIHLNDIRADVAVDAVNITGSDKSVDDMRDLLNKKDTSGRLLSYRIVIKDAQVKAVFHHSGKAKRAKFIEETLPSIGSLVAVNYQQQHLQSSTVSFSSTLATLLWVPAGMIVKSSMKSSKKKKGEGEEDDTENEEVDDIIDGKQDITFPKSNFCSCRRKHPVELPGFVHVRLEQHVGVTEKGEDEITVFPEVQGNDEDVLAASTVEGKKDCLMSSDDDDISQRCSPRRRYISVPVCCLRKATEQEKSELKKRRDDILESHRTELLESIAKLETLIKDMESSSSSSSWSDIERLRKRIGSLSLKDDLKDLVDPRRIKAADRALRYIAFQRRAVKRVTK
mmetsp:Transcript_27437/g.38275  ORF Transcript_27437/g.38275 Transcript_27437/m.38275 type:complete len:413 (-) Transcript_27437:91-1329(-)|eukprot:CAMPEP_0185281492 /NCGR_PEP_ID=MMETSP1359-20130426/66753_1 /TAXON_ID=552665 /ORGANISM="Bigelowiella longifila, Strain CCMP242" /LENGTH=412 /DNA_ID=CAMNT_0027876939 /DNA_START=474 /DNA_END=1712 /DNA_ORIENTATION=-